MKREKTTEKWENDSTNGMESNIIEQKTTQIDSVSGEGRRLVPFVAKRADESGLSGGGVAGEHALYFVSLRENRFRFTVRFDH